MIETSEKHPGGRPKGGTKFGGRQKGTPNKATVLRKQAMIQAVIDAMLDEEKAGELTPLWTMRRIMRERLRAGDLDGALAAASAAAPYCHAKLLSSDVRVRNEYTSKSDAELAAETAELERKLATANRVH